MTSTTTELSLDEIFNLAKAALINNGANEENADAVATTVTNAETRWLSLSWFISNSWVC